MEWNTIKKVLDFYMGMLADFSHSLIKTLLKHLQQEIYGHSKSSNSLAYIHYVINGDKSRTQIDQMNKMCSVTD